MTPTSGTDIPVRPLGLLTLRILQVLSDSSHLPLILASRRLDQSRAFLLNPRDFNKPRGALAFSTQDAHLNFPEWMRNRRTNMEMHRPDIIRLSRWEDGA